MLDYLYNQSISNSMAVVASAKEMVLKTFSVYNKMNLLSSKLNPCILQLHEIIEEALHSPCETLHTAVYAWMIEKGLHGELVALATPSLEAYLIRVNAPELLWQFYERNKNHAAAAKILYALATKVGYVNNQLNTDLNEY